MSTWRVPEGLKDQINELVPDVYPSTTEAVIELCKIGLHEVAKTKLSDKALIRTIYNEEFWLELQVKPKQATIGELYPTLELTLPPTGYPLGPLKLQSLKFAGSISSGEADYASVRVISHGVESGRAAVPFNWILQEFEIKDEAIRIDPSGADSFLVRVTAHNGYLPPRGHYYARVRRWM